VCEIVVCGVGSVN